MISADEIRRIAGALSIDPRVVDHDYVIGCYLHYLAINSDVQESWIFKGGTSLQKSHFGLYRFSEDLDFTLRSPLTADGVKYIADQAKHELQHSIGIRTDEVSTLVEMMNDDYGRESVEVRIYYRGPGDYRGSPRSVRLHLSGDEIVVFTPLSKRIIHNYSDAGDLPSITLKTYSLEEVLVEKLRAFSGQRKYAIARDIFDIHYLLTKGVDRESSIKALRDKCEFKGIKVDSINTTSVESRKAEFRVSWNDSLAYLLPAELKTSFDDAWDSSTTLLKEAVEYYQSH